MSNSRATMSGTRSVQRIPYGPGPLQFGELRLPEGSAPVPIVVVVHGGCWLAQFDTEHITPAVIALTGEGFATWTVEYRRLGDAGGGWPGTFEDIARAVAKLPELASADPRLDLEKVVIAGHSAGGQLALWAASRRAGDPLDAAGADVPPLPLAGVVGLAAITDLAAYGVARGSCNRSVTPLLGGRPGEQPERYGAVSPIERLPIGVPLRLVHGERDGTVPIASARAFVAAARAAGDDAGLDAVAGAEHMDVIEPGSRAWPAVLGAVQALTGGPAGRVA